MGLSLVLVSQYPTYVIAQQYSQPSVIEDRQLNFSRTLSADNTTMLEKTTSSPSDFATEPEVGMETAEPSGFANHMTEENMTGDSMNSLKGAREQGNSGDFASLQLPPAVSDLLRNTTEPGDTTDFESLAPDAAPSDFEMEKFGSKGPVGNAGNAGNAGDFKDDETKRFELNTRKIANELIGLTPVEIRQYPVTDLSVTDIKAVLGFLNSFHLAKVLLNIPEGDLLEVKNMLSPITFNQTINKLSIENRTQVEDRLFTVSAIP